MSIALDQISILTYVREGRWDRLGQDGTGGLPEVAQKSQKNFGEAPSAGPFLCFSTMKIKHKKHSKKTYLNFALLL